MSNTLFILFDVLYLFLSIFYLPYLIVKGKWHNVYLVRFGFFRKQIRSQLGRGNNVWVHAVSVGEVLAVLELIKSIKKEFPDLNIVCSTVTRTGQQLALEQLKGQANVIYAPVDFSIVVRTFIRLIRPKLFISTETELWPNLYTFLHKYQTPIMVINGRISDKSYAGYNRFRALTKGILSKVSCFCMQSPLDAERIVSLGADPKKVRVTGNIKFDSVISHNGNGEHELPLQENYKWFIAGSTHPGEEEIILDIYKKLKEQSGDVRLIIAPRHIERYEELSGIVLGKQLNPVRLSDVRNRDVPSEDVILVDTIGRLRQLYRIAYIVFIGKTLRVGGGQNMIEPAQFGKPVFVGPLTQNFKDVVRTFLNNKAILQAADEAQLSELVLRLFPDERKLKQIGESAKKVVMENQGVGEKTLEAIKSVLKR